MFERDIYTIHSTYREDMHIKGFQFGKGEKSACIVGAARGNEIQQMYICSQLVKTLRELENNGCISAGKQILVLPTINAYSVNISRRFFGVKEADINRSFPGNDYGEPADRLTNALLTEIKDYVYGIQFTSFYRPGEFVPHVRMMETGYQNTSLANLFGLPYVVVRKPVPIDTKTLNYNWQDEMTAAFSVYTNQNSQIDEASARQAVAAVLRFLKRMGLIRYESHSGYISHVLYEKDLSDVHTNRAGIFRGKVHAGDDVRYGNEMAEIIDPYDGSVRETILAPTGGIVCPFGLNIALAENAAENGVEFYRDHKVTAIVEQRPVWTENPSAKEGRMYQVQVDGEIFEAPIVINAAGVYADEIHNMICEEKICIVPRRGEYRLMDKNCGDLVNSTIFQQPSKMGKGILVTPTVHGNLLVGPTAEDIPDKQDVDTTAEGLAKVLNLGSNSVDALDGRQTITSFA